MALSLVIIGIAIALDPLPLTAFIVVLASKRGAMKGAMFVLGWLLSLIAIVAGTLLVTGNKPPAPSTAPSTAALAVKILIGVVLVYFAARQRRRMGQPKKPKKTPKWQTGVDNMSPWYAMGLAPLTQPWGLLAAGVAVVVDAKVSSWQSTVALILFCLIASSSYIGMELHAWLRPEKSQAFLTRLRMWIDTHTDQVIIVLSLVVGLWLIGDDIYLLVT